MTLVEVLAALAILGITLSAVLVARARYLRQYVDAGKQLRAVQAADDLMKTWFGSAKTITVPAGGEVPGPDHWRWKLDVLHGEAAGLPGVRVARLNIEDSSVLARQTQPLLSIDVALPEAARGDSPPGQIQTTERAGGVGANE